MRWSVGAPPSDQRAFWSPLGERGEALAAEDDLGVLEARSVSRADEGDESDGLGVVVPHRDDDHDERVVGQESDADGGVAGGGGLPRGAVAGQRRMINPRL